MHSEMNEHSGSQKQEPKTVGAEPQSQQLQQRLKAAPKPAEKYHDDTDQKGNSVEKPKKLLIGV